MALALSRIDWATAVHLASWSGVILSAVLSWVMRCSTVSGLLLVAAAAAGGVLLSGVCAATGPREPAIKAAPVNDAMANERAKGLNWRKFFMRTSFAKKMRPRCPPHPGQAGRWLGNASSSQGVPANQGAPANTFGRTRFGRSCEARAVRAIRPFGVRPRP